MDFSHFVNHAQRRRLGFGLCIAVTMGFAGVSKAAESAGDTTTPPVMTAEALDATLKTATEKLSSENVKTLRHVSRALLGARSQERQRIKTQMQTDVDALNGMQQTLASLEKAARAEAFVLQLEQRDTTPQSMSINGSLDITGEGIEASEIIDLDGNVLSAPASKRPGKPRKKIKKRKGKFTPEVARAEGKKRRMKAKRKQKMRDALAMISDQKSRALERKAQKSQSKRFAKLAKRGKKQAQRRSDRLAKVTADIEQKLLAMQQSDTVNLKKIKRLQAKLALKARAQTPQTKPTLQTLTRHRR